MGVVVVQDKSAQAETVAANGSVTVALSTTTVGNTLILCVFNTDANATGGGDVFTPSGGGVTTWNTAKDAEDTVLQGIHNAIFYGAITSHATSVSVATKNGSAIGFSVFVKAIEVSGLTSAPLDAAGVELAATSSTTGTLTQNSGSVTTANNSDFIIAMNGQSGYGPETGAAYSGPGSGWTAFVTVQQGGVDGGQGSALVAAYQSVSSVGSYSTTWTFTWTDPSTQANEYGMIAAFKIAAIAFVGEDAPDPRFFLRTRKTPTHNVAIFS